MLPSNIPNDEIDFFIVQFFYIETNSWNGICYFAEF